MSGQPQRPARNDEPTGPMTPLDAEETPPEGDADEIPFADTREQAAEPTPGTGPTDRLRELVGGEERADWRRRLILALTVGLGGWLAFLVVDLIGTPGYIAPEVIGGAPADARADVYALGAVLYYLLVGRMLFEGETVQAVVLAHLHRDVAPPSEGAPHPVPSAIDAIVLRCRQKDPAARFADGEELARALLAR